MNKELVTTLLKISEKTSMLLIAEEAKDYAMYKGKIKLFLKNTFSCCHFF